LAGYLFTRRGYSGHNGADQIPTVAAPPQPGKPSFDTATKKLKLPGLQRGSDYYEVFGRNVSKTGSVTVAARKSASKRWLHSAAEFHRNLPILNLLTLCGYAAGPQHLTSGSLTHVHQRHVRV